MVDIWDDDTRKNPPPDEIELCDTCPERKDCDHSCPDFEKHYIKNKEVYNGCL